MVSNYFVNFYVYNHGQMLPLAVLFTMKGVIAETLDYIEVLRKRDS